MTTTHHQRTWIDLTAVALLSAAMLAFELTLTRLFALAQFYHFAFMAISLALLGGGAAGTLLTIWPRIGSRPVWWAACFSVGVLVSFAILRLVPFDSYAIAWQPIQILYLVLTFGGAVLPFLCSGVVVGAFLAEDSARLHRVYAANLAGSALGSVGVLPLLAALGGEGALFLSAALGLLAAALLLAARDVERVKRLPAYLGLAAGAAGLIATALLTPGWARVEISPYKALSQTRLAPDAEHTVSRWSAAVRVDVVESSSIHVMPGLSANAAFSNPPPQAALTLDGDNLAPITGLAPDEDLTRTLAASVPLAIVEQIVPHADRFLILYPGAGWDVLMTLAADENHLLPTGAVTVVERHQPVLNILRDEYADFTHGLLADPRVQVVSEHGRTYLRQTDQRYHVIDMALSDSYHPVTAGAFTLTEDYRYTVDAMHDALGQLAPDGVMIVTRWLQTPPTESLRLLAALERTLRAQGVAAPGDHIAAFRSMRTMTLVASPDPLTANQIAGVQAFAAGQGYDLVWLPGISPDEVNQHNRLPAPVYYDSFRALLGNPENIISSHAFDIRPPTDSRPFFFHYFRWGQTPRILQQMGRTWQPFGGSGYLVLVALLILVSLLAAGLIIIPLLAARRGGDLRAAPGDVRWRALLYFAMLGLGFLFIEIPLAQQFILYIGHPTAALAVVLFAVLLFSGIGSFTAPRWPLRRALGLLIAITVIMPFLLRGVFTLSLGGPIAARVAITIAALAPLGLLMGVPFSRGLALIEEAAPGLTPWAWAVNGSVSVISAVLAMMIALSRGFPVVLWIGAGTYVVALIALWPITDRVQPAG